MSKQKQTFIDRYHMYPWYLNLAVILFYFFGSLSSPLYTSVLQYQNIKSDPFTGTVYPIEFVPEYLAMKSGDRDKTYLELDDSVFIKMPEYNSDIISRNIDNQKPGDDEYEETLAARVIYSTMYMGTYNFDYKEYEGSHLAIDIKSPIGAPVRNIANGVIVQVGDQPSGFGNFVVIKHNNVPLPNGGIGTIYSGYAHMNEVYVKVGRKTDKGAVIGTVGNSGMSFGSHLHFQIDLETAPYHPYRPFTGNEAREANVNFFEAINIGLGKDNGLKYTINPGNFVYDNINNILVEKEVEEVKLVASNIEDIKTEEIIKESINEDEVALLEDNIELESAKEEIIKEEIIKEEIIKEEIIKEEIIKEEIVKEEIVKEEVVIIKKETFEEIVKEEVEIIKIEKIELFEDNLSLFDDNLIINDSVEVALLDTNDILFNSNIDILNDIVVVNSNDLLLEEEIVEEEIVEEEIVEEEIVKEEVIIKKEILDEVVKDEDQIVKEENIVASEVKDIISTEINTTIVFDDINTDNKYYEAIKYLKEKGVINGFSDNTFRDESNITRAEALKIILLSFGETKDLEANKRFSDVSVNSWENGYISKGIKLFLVNSNNTEFYPNRTINRVEGLKMLLKITKVELDSYSDKNILTTDAKKEDWFYKYIVYSVENKLLEIKNNLFEPEKSLTRGELVNMIYLMIEK